MQRSLQDPCCRDATADHCSVGKPGCCSNHSAAGPGFRLLNQGSRLFCYFRAKGEEPIKLWYVRSKCSSLGIRPSSLVLGSGCVKAGCITFHLQRSTTQALGTNCTRAYPAKPVCPRTRLREKQPASKRPALPNAKEPRAPLWVPFSGESPGSRNSAFAGCSVHWWGSRDWTLPSRRMLLPGLFQAESLHTRMTETAQQGLLQRERGGASKLSGD